MVSLEISFSLISTTGINGSPKLAVLENELFARHSMKDIYIYIGHISVALFFFLPSLPFSSVFLPPRVNCRLFVASSPFPLFERVAAVSLPLILFHQPWSTAHSPPDGDAVFVRKRFVC